MGCIGVVIFAALQAAGGILDLFGGFAMAQVFDPQSGVSTSLFGRCYNLHATTLLFVIGGHLLLVRGFLRYFDAVPAMVLPTGSPAHVLMDEVAILELAGIEIAATLPAALFLPDVHLGLLQHVERRGEHGCSRTGRYS